jgi:Tol biopolymer transport system component
LSSNVAADFTGTALPSTNGRIVFTSGRGATDGISTINEDGSGRRDIPNGFVNQRYPAWSPDGTKIAFTKEVYSAGNYLTKIFVMNSDGTNVAQLTDGTGAGRPAWSPDGAKIAFADQTENGLEIFVMNSDGTGQTMITSTSSNYAPAWSPDGSKIAFVAERDFDREIYVMNVDGSNQTRLTFSPQDDLNPAWSPDGMRIAFDSFRDFNREIYVMNADGSNQVNITNDPAIDAEPAWSPSGTKIAFSSYLRSSNGGIFIMNADGSNAVELTNTGDGSPSWTGSAGATPTPTPAPTPTPKATTATTVVSSLNPSAAGQSVSFTANVTGRASLTGNVQFIDGSSPLGTVTLSGNSATLSISVLTPGIHSITAVYGGDANSESSTSPTLNQIVYPVLSAVTLNPKSVAGSNSSTGTVALTGPAPPGGISVALTSDNSAAAVPQNVPIGAGADTATFTITTTEVTANSTAHLSATWNGTTKRGTLTVLPFALKSLTVTPTSVTGGVSATGKVTLNGTAPAGGKLVALASDNGAATAPDNVTVPEGSSSATFAITTTPVEATTLTTLSGTFNGVTKTDTLTVKEPMVKSVKLAPASLTGGASSTATITLSGAAPSGGTTVSLTSNNVAATLPASLMVAEGATVATFSITTSPVSNDLAVSITAMAEDTSPRTATLTIKAPAPTSLSLSPGSVVGGTSSTATVNLSGIAPAGGIEVTLSSADSAASIPATIVIAEGQHTTTFTVTTTPEPVNHIVAISASRGPVTRTANVTVKAPTPVSLSLTPAVVTGGSSSIAALTLTGPAPEGGIEVPLSTANAAAVLPPSVSVPPGGTSISFSVGTTPVAAQTTGIVSATYNGVTRSDSLAIKAPVTSSVALNPTQVGGGATVAGTVTLTGPAPAGGAVVQLISSKTAVATVPANVTVAPGDTTATFAITTNTVTASQSATISATLNGVKKSATLSVVPVALSGIGANPASIRVGDSTFLTVTLNGPAPPAGFAVSLSSSNSTIVNVPASVNIPAGTFSITITAPASAPGTTNVTAFANGVSYVAVVTASP